MPMNFAKGIFGKELLKRYNSKRPNIYNENN
jgi:hypothetical protein